MAHPSRYDNSHSDLRPTLPPIRDLFRDELSRHPDALHESPSLPLARLHVTDDDDYPISSSNPSNESTRHAPRRAYGLPIPAPGPPAHFYQSNLYREFPQNSAPTRTDYPISQPNLQSYNHVVHRPPYTSTYTPAMTNHHAYTSLSTPYHEPHGHPTHFLPQDAASRPAYPSHVSPKMPFSYRGDPAMVRHRSTSTLSDTRSPRLAWNVSTASSSEHTGEDDEQTPVARFHNTAATGLVNIPHADVHQLPDENMGGSASKYDCPYCGKGFNRPSSLKIHLNSHTGEKPFVCPVESCGRSFSVLSNMRRHARVHSAPDHEPAGGDSPIPAALTTAASSSRLSPGRWNMHRRNSTSSSTGSVSRRSRSISSNDDHGSPEGRRLEKRSRRNLDS